MLKQLLPILQRFTHLTYRRLQLFLAFNKLCLVLLLRKIKSSQPLYHLPLFKIKRQQRVCIDRADTIYHTLKPWGQGGHILEIGCEVGYYAHYFAERGYLIDAIDANRTHIRICQLLQRLHYKKKKIHFSHTAFSATFLEQLQANHYDIVFLLNVVHHWLHTNGLSQTQQWMAALLEKIPVLVIELAVKNEKTQAPWRESLPQDALAIFATCKDISIQRIDFFPQEESGLRRPLYLIKKNALVFCGQMYTIQNRRFTAHFGCYYGRAYYDCGQHYIKRYRLQESSRNQEGHILQEIAHYQTLPANTFLPKLLAYQQRDQTIEIVFSKLPGKTVHEYLAKGEPIVKLAVFVGLVKALSFLLQQGLFHNDIRIWNVMIDQEKTYLLDLELAAREEKECTTIALLWVIAEIHQFSYYDFPYPLKTKPIFARTKLSPEFVQIVAALEKTLDFKAFLLWFTEAGYDSMANLPKPLVKELI